MPRSPQPARRSAASRSARRDARSRIADACRRAVRGKLAVRDLALWVDGFGVSETEFRLLWLLFNEADGAPAPPRTVPREFDQAELAARLAVSAAQVSASVERLHREARLERVSQVADRRRQLWRLSPSGRSLVLKVVAAVDALPPVGDAGMEAA
jgi:DNA-binding MarR family transcriptional regulator